MPYNSWSVIAGETPTATKWNLLGENDSDFNTRLSILEVKPSNRAFAWFLSGTESVRNEAGAVYIAPQDMTVVKIWGRSTGTNVQVRIKVDATVIDVFDFGVTVSSTTSFNSTTILAGQVITLDVTAINGSASNIIVCMECEQ